MLWNQNAITDFLEMLLTDFWKCWTTKLPTTIEETTNNFWSVWIPYMKCLNPIMKCLNPITLAALNFGIVGPRNYKNNYWIVWIPRIGFKSKSLHAINKHDKITTCETRDLARESDIINYHHAKIKSWCVPAMFILMSWYVTSLLFLQLINPKIRIL